MREKATVAQPAKIRNTLTLLNVMIVIRPAVLARLQMNVMNARKVTSLKINHVRVAMTIV